MEEDKIQSENYLFALQVEMTSQADQLENKRKEFWSYLRND